MLQKPFLHGIFLCIGYLLIKILVYGINFCDIEFAIALAGIRFCKMPESAKLFQWSSKKFRNFYLRFYSR